MISPVQNCGYNTNFTGSIKMNPAMKSVQKTLNGFVVNEDVYGIYNLFKKIKNDGTANELNITLSKEKVYYRTHIANEHVINIKYGDKVRKYYDSNSLGFTILSRLLQFGEELFGKEELRKLNTQKLERARYMLDEADQLSDEIKLLQKEIERIKSKKLDVERDVMRLYGDAIDEIVEQTNKLLSK
jgi:hypothetical protein